MSGGQATRQFIRNINKDDTVQLEDSILLVDTTDGDVTITLPPIRTFSKSIFHVMKISPDLNVVTVEPSLDDSLINDQTFFEINSQYIQLGLQNIGEKWIALFENTTLLGWRDIIDSPTVQEIGPNKPIWTQLDTSVFFAYKVDLNDELWFTYHVPHDWSPGTPMYFHTHWCPDGIDTGIVRWEYTYVFAAHPESLIVGPTNFAIPTGAIVVISENEALGAWQHISSEIPSPIDTSSLQVDTLILMRLRRVTNGGVDNTDSIFLLSSDLHYQADRVNTLLRGPQFYGS